MFLFSWPDGPSLGRLRRERVKGKGRGSGRGFSAVAVTHLHFLSYALFLVLKQT